jgi:hypothetical protein
MSTASLPFPQRTTAHRHRSLSPCWSSPRLDKHPPRWLTLTLLTTCGSWRSSPNSDHSITIGCPGLCEIQNLQAQHFTKDLSRRGCSWGPAVAPPLVPSWLNRLKAERLPRLQKFPTGAQGYRVYMAALEPRSYKSSSHTPLKG